MEAENIPLDVLYEDENMLIINKPAGILTHPTSIEREHTLVNALLFHCKGNLSGINGIMRPGILHRLDRDTSGLLMIAKNDFAHQFLAEQIRTKTAVRQYLAIVHGVIEQDEGTIDAPIDRHPTQRHKMGVVEDGKKSITHWKVLERFEKFTFLEATLETGRTHQIRVHLRYINHPIVSDPIYRGSKELALGMKRLALHSTSITFKLPNGEQKTVESPTPSDFEKVIKKYLPTRKIGIK